MNAKKTETLAAFGQKVKALRKAAGLSQEELAEKLGFSHKSSISKIELGKNDIPTGKIEALAEALGVDPGALLNPNHKIISEKKQDPDLHDLIIKKYGQPVSDLFDILIRLDPEDRAEIRGMARLMLMDKKYTEKNIKRA